MAFPRSMEIEIIEDGRAKSFMAEIFDEENGRYSGYARIEDGDAVSFQGRNAEELREHFLVMRAGHLADKAVHS